MLFKILLGSNTGKKYKVFYTTAASPCLPLISQYPWRLGHTSTILRICSLRLAATHLQVSSFSFSTLHHSPCLRVFFFFSVKMMIPPRWRLGLNFPKMKDDLCPFLAHSSGPTFIWLLRAPPSFQRNICCCVLLLSSRTT
ncbi:hypothetical protein VIGAN_UM067000 [Vigna angularis var. angularis]|uniref:Uncharacterized protein n=1 Tax=Vigna angularis var. angularis TaxID=157739 RepID=A0A0S3TDS2_PHAAN|nr:hypothetical protein VIGAN_UM067000 [Vigna angularis var. angularis]